MKTALLLHLTFVTLGSAFAVEKARPLSHQVAELLISRSGTRQSEGISLLAKERNGIVTSLVHDLSSRNSMRIGAAAFEVAVIFSPWARSQESSSRFIQFTTIYELRRPVRRASAIPEANDIRRALMDAFTWLRKRSEAEPPDFLNEDSMKSVTWALGEFSTDDTVDWALVELGEIKSPYITEKLFMLCQDHMGSPPIFRADLICGNSSEAEVKKFMVEQSAALAKATAELRRSWQSLKLKSTEQRMEASISSWRSLIVPKMRQYSGSYFHNGWLSTEFAPLIRYGGAALPLLKTQRAKESDLGERAIWDYFIAAITGATDETTVRTLLNGSDAQREMACEIIAASGEQKWASDLENLKMVNDYHLGKASQALAACLGARSIPYLERIHARYPKESDTEYALKELKARDAQGDPRRRLWYRQ